MLSEETAQPTKRVSMRRFLIVTLLSVLVIGVLIFLAIGGPKRFMSDEQLIRARVAALEQAIADRDADAAVACMASRDRAMLSDADTVSDEQFRALLGQTRYTIGAADIKVAGNSAAVTLTVTAELLGKTETTLEELDFLKEDGDWFFLFYSAVDKDNPLFNWFGECHDCVRQDVPLIMVGETFLCEDCFESR